MTDPKIEPPKLPTPTAEQLAAIHHAGRTTPGAQEIIRRVNAETPYALMTTANIRRDRRVYHATRNGKKTLCGKQPLFPVCLAPRGDLAVTCVACLARMDQENEAIARNLGYKKDGQI